jgi:glycosyltransferase involved in cell wall biosynthesis
VHVAVLLSTYNGERWLTQQLDSVLSQSHVDLVVNVRDDGSTDGTPALLERYAGADSRLHWVAGDNLGPAQSFLRLLADLDAETAFAAFCDQDDVWEPDHLERAIHALGSRDSRRPLLWCSDVLVCDADLQPLRRHDAVRRGPSFPNALVENIAPGSTIVLNRAAIDLLASATPTAPVMHDAWCYLVIAAMGEVLYDPAPSVRYRLHGDNALGLTAGWLRVAARLRRLWSGPHAGAWTRQARELQRLYPHRLAPAEARELQRFVAGQTDAVARLRYTVAGKARRQRGLGTLAMRLAYLAGRI